MLVDPFWWLSFNNFVMFAIIICRDTIIKFYFLWAKSGLFYLSLSLSLCRNGVPVAIAVNILIQNFWDGIKLKCKEEKKKKKSNNTYTTDEHGLHTQIHTKKIAYYIRFDKQLWYRRQQGSKLLADERVRKMGTATKLLAAQEAPEVRMKKNSV